MPFQHWVCSHECAEALEEPARHEQIAKARELDARYEHYVHECQRVFYKCKNKRKVLSCLSKEDGDYISDCDTVVSDSTSYRTTESEYEEESPQTEPKNCTIM